MDLQARICAYVTVPCVFVCLGLCLCIVVWTFSFKWERFEKLIFLGKVINNLKNIPVIFNFPAHKHSLFQQYHSAHTWESDELSHFPDEMY